MTKTASQSVSIPMWVTDFIMIGALAPLIRLSERHITALTEAVGQPTTRLEVFILSYLRNLIPRSMNPPMGVGFADNSEEIFHRLLKNCAVTERMGEGLTDTAASLEIDIQTEINRPHAEFNLLDLSYLEQLIQCVAHPETSFYITGTHFGNIAVCEIDDQGIYKTYRTANKHLSDRFPYCEWLTIIVLGLSLYQGKNSSPLILPDELKIKEGPEKAIRELMAPAFNDALELTLE